jgi:hypothetical protein
MRAAVLMLLAAITLPDGVGRIRGPITDHDGSPLAGVSVTITGVNRDPRLLTTDGEGVEV